MKSMLVLRVRISIFLSVSILQPEWRCCGREGLSGSGLALLVEYRLLMELLLWDFEMERELYSREIEMV
jgi:hypothetical protein